MSSIKTDPLSAKLRERSIRPESREVLISRLDGSDQEDDLTEPPNCGGFGRIRHFHQDSPEPWPPNPLPILPAAVRLGVSPELTSNAQVFQNSACNWRCWYCFVPFNLLAANEAHAGWLTSDQIVALYLAEDSRPLVIDCSGGQPDLIPEWLLWMMEALRARGIDRSVYVWSDDNLSNDYFWRFLTADQRRLVADYPAYGRVCCFKGFNAASFAFNTKAEPSLFERQFHLFKRLLSLGIDIYAYATFTAPADEHLCHDMASFVDRLQELHSRLPLRLVPLRIETFRVVQPRVQGVHERALLIQEDAVAAWNDELRLRFSEADRSIPMPLVSLDT